MKKDSDKMTEPIYINDYQEAKLFFEEYGIPYQEIAKGEDKGKLLVRETELNDQLQIHEAEKRLRRSRLQNVIDHPNAFLDKDDNVIVTFSPYDATELPKDHPWLEMSDYSIYGNGTKTFVVRIKREDITAAELKELEQKIRSAEDEFFHFKKEYDSALEKLSKLLDRRDEIRRGLDGGRVTLKKWSYTWEGNAVWDNGSGTTDCNYQAQMTFRTKDAIPHGKQILKLKTETPGFTDKDVIKALQDSLRNELDSQFEDYCTEDDYYPPVVEDFEAEEYAKDWAETRGLELIFFEGAGSDEGSEPRHRRW